MFVGDGGSHPFIKARRISCKTTKGKLPTSKAMANILLSQA